MIYDAHTHGRHAPDSGTVLMTNIRAGIDDIVCTYPFSCGIHPYDVGKTDADAFFSTLETLSPAAIGETGLDFRFQESAALQVRIFRRHVQAARRMGLPVILHAVKALPQALKILDGVPFVFHGFRGNADQAAEIVRQGGMISFSPHFPAGAAALFREFRDSTLLETDDTGTGIREHYASAAAVFGTEPEELEETIGNNFKRMFNGLELQNQADAWRRQLR